MTMPMRNDNKEDEKKVLNEMEELTNTTEQKKRTKKRIAKRLAKVVPMFTDSIISFLWFFPPDSYSIRKINQARISLGCCLGSQSFFSWYLIDMVIE